MTARQEFEANLVGRYGGAALDPTSHELTIADLDAIEAEAVVAERARLRAAVEGLYGQFHPMCAVEAEPTRHDVVSRKAVLDLLTRADQ